MTLIAVAVVLAKLRLAENAGHSARITCAVEAEVGSAAT
jgi:hypothetical protein